MNRKNYFFVTAVVFAVIGLFHLLRIVIGWEAVVAGWVVPIWISWIGLVVTAVFAFFGFTYGRKEP